MSAKKRRIKRKLTMLRRLDATYHRLYLMASPKRDGHRSWCLWLGCVVPLGDALQRRGVPAWQSLPRGIGGPDILLHNYNKRRGAV